MLRRLKTPRIFRFFLLAVCAVFLIVVHPEAHSQDANSLGETAGKSPGKLRVEGGDHGQCLQPPHLVEHPDDDDRRNDFLWGSLPAPTAKLHGGAHPARGHRRHRHVHREPGPTPMALSPTRSRCLFLCRASARTESTGCNAGADQLPELPVDLGCDGEGYP